ncbi:hypothetical protein JCM3774_006807 [Rhodotorula dairenensis]
MSGRPKMLSSQPKRSWGDSDDENERPEFVLNSEDWPPTPPKPRPTKPSTVAYSSTTSLGKGKAVARTVSGAGVKVGSLNSTSSSAPTTTTATASRQSRSGAGTRPLVGRHSEPSRPSQPLVDIPLAPLFSRQRPPSAGPSSSASRPMASSSGSQNRIATGSTMFALNNPATAGSNGSALPKKRSLPWEELEATSSRNPRAGSKNFHELSGPSNGWNKRRISSEVKGKLLTSDSLDIKQKVVLSPEQQVVLRRVVEEGKSVFFTGSAGTGKSVLLREIISSLKRKYRGSGDAVAVTASTGMAACNIGGTTIHSFAGIGLGLGTPDQLVGNVLRNKTAKTKWQRVKVLVIDEVSMVDAQLFDKLAYIATKLRQKAGSKTANKPFGGIQLVVTGDFFQLPPVTKGSKNPSFAFEAAAWKESIQHTVNLTQVFRQKDTRFIDMLNEMRFGKLSEASIKAFYALAREPNLGDMEPTELFPMRNEVDRANQTRLRALPGVEVSYKAVDSANGSSNPTDLQKSTYLQNFMAPETLVIKVGAQVMLIKNLDVDLVNGTIGKVVKIGIPDLQDDDEDEENAIDGAIDPTGARIRAAAAEDARKKKLVADVARGAVEEAPCVQWQTPSGPLTKWMTREEFKVEDNAGKLMASRKQYPIILAWAMSIHKSQGQTIPCVKVDLGRVFEKGQSYVALSRATSLDGLQVLRFDPSKVKAHDTVVSWSKTLGNATNESLS